MPRDDAATPSRAIAPPTPPKRARRAGAVIPTTAPTPAKPGRKAASLTSPTPAKPGRRARAVGQPTPPPTRAKPAERALTGTSSPPEAAYGPDFHRTLVDNLSAGVYFVDRERTITYWNRGAEHLTGYEPGFMVGRRCYSGLLAHVDDAGTPLCHTGCPLAATIEDGREREIEVWLRHRDGHRRPVRVRAAPIRDGDGRIIGAVEVFEDDSATRAARQAAAAARHDALTDELTGLANRRQLDAALAGRVANFRRHGWLFGVLMADVDHFKRVNDAHGHAAGDAALRSVAASLDGAVRTGDTVGRWGGEEFLVIAAAADRPTLERTAERLRAIVESSRVLVGESYLPVTISVGGALAVPSDGAADVVARADRALYAAKAAGRNRVVIDG